MPSRTVIKAMPDDVKKYVKRKAKEKGVSMSNYIVELIRQDAGDEGIILSQVNPVGNPKWVNKS